MVFWFFCACPHYYIGSWLTPLKPAPSVSFVFRLSLPPSILSPSLYCSISFFALSLSASAFFCWVLPNHTVFIAFGFSSDFSDSLSWSSIDIPLSFFQAFAFGGFRSFIQSLFLGDSQRSCLVCWFHGEFSLGFSSVIDQLQDSSMMSAF